MAWVRRYGAPATFLAFLPIIKALLLLRCDEMQGYLFSKPLPEADIAGMLPRIGVPGAQS